MIDTHAHIDFGAYDEDRDEALKRAFDAGVESVIIPAVEPKDYRRVLELAESDDRLFCAMGVHPHNASEFNEEVLDAIEKNLSCEKVKAVGEIGLDYHYDFTPKDVQKKVFRRQLQIAKENDLPAIIHNREADEDILEIIEEERDDSLKGVMHCFSSDEEFLKKVLDLGFLVSFTGNITFKNTDLDGEVKKAPLNKIMLETDSPFMTPVPNRGKRNEPAYVEYVAKKIAEIKSKSIDEVIKMTTKTAKTFFNLSIYILLTFALSLSVAFAQDYEGDEYAEEDSVKYELYNPYKKFIGIGPVVGTNTVVQTQHREDGEHDISYNGLFTYGGAITYQIIDELLIEAAFNYSRKKAVPENNDFTDNIYRNLEICTHWVVNPYSRVNFYGTFGAAGMFNTYNSDQENQIGLIGGLGLYINFPSDFGLFVLSGEWRINFELERSQINIIKDDESKEPIEAISFLSIPRITLFYFPPLK